MTMHYSEEVPPPPLPPQSSPTRRWLPWLIGGVALFVVLCGIVAVLGGVRLFQSAQRETGDILSVVDQFMKTGAQQNAQAGFALFAHTADTTNVTQETIEQLFATRRDLFQGYQSAQQESFQINTGTGGTRATLSGTLTYTDQSIKPFTATLFKEQGQWKLTSIRFPEGVGG